MPSNPLNRHEEYRNKLLGLGESSLRKNYYPELRKHMRELENSRTRYQAIFNATADGLFIHDAETFKIIDINERVCQMFGYTYDEILNLDFNKLCSGIPPYTEQDAKEYLKTAIAKGMQNFEWISRRKDNNLFWCDVCLKSATIDGEQCIIASVRDISSRKLLEEQLLHSQKMEAMGQLAGGVAHDFNNMLSGIIGSAEVIHTMSKDNDKIRELCEIILKAANTAGNLTTQLLSFSRKGTFEQNLVHVHNAINNASGILQRSFDRNIYFNLELNAKNDIILGNLALIENIIINMSLNARDSMPDGGKLIIQTKNQNRKADKIPDAEDLPEQRYICITISDTGFGMTEEIQQHIFEPFFTTKETGKGTGLGLAAVYGAVQRHNGFIEVKSSLGSGTTFNIYLPLTRQEKPDTLETTSHITGSGKILLIDDEEILRRVGTSILNTLGYDVITAKDGLQGIEKFKSETPDLVLLDMVMPKISSTDCFDTLKSINPDIPVIAVSGFIEDTTVEELFNKGLAGFIEKPFKINPLSQKIASTLLLKKGVAK